MCAASASPCAFCVFDSSAFVMTHLSYAANTGMYPKAPSKMIGNQLAGVVWLVVPGLLVAVKVAVFAPVVAELSMRRPDVPAPCAEFCRNTAAAPLPELITAAND